MISKIGTTGYMDRLIRHINLENANMIKSCEKCIHNILTKSKKVTFDKKYGQTTNWGNIKIPARGDSGLDNILPRPHALLREHKHKHVLRRPQSHHYGLSTERKYRKKVKMDQSYTIPKYDNMTAGIAMDITLQMVKTDFPVVLLLAEEEEVTVVMGTMATT